MNKLPVRLANNKTRMVNHPVPGSSLAFALQTSDQLTCVCVQD